ncbi:XRE family transcriptional regulator [Novosphingobium sp. Rr 2-17]|uniref:helix-turn-helix domain-containing protein n=1 Tax=Novosphingobium sp. Rr 2-17 TaxID=555793 RepID=UPI0002699B45|nr:helix-turn-helix domain-containing protein [Novosphingobium sp. Rr 2-17]EIZ81073.1 XRE family transcriptional regulator [Novosphingobium sp. Rr 2-17]
MPMEAHFEQRSFTAEGVGRLRAERRRLLLEAQGALESGAQASVMVHNISATGLLIESKVDLEVEEGIELVLPGAVIVRARVVWASGQLFGCAFETPLPRAALSAAELRSAVQVEAGLGTSPLSAAPTTVGGESMGERLHRLRKLRGLTQGELASRLGVSKPTVWAWEQDRARPIEDRMEAIAEALEVTAAELRPGRAVPGLAELITRCRGQIATALEVPTEKVRIMVDL